MSLVESIRRQMPEGVAKASEFTVGFDSNRATSWRDQDLPALTGLYYPHNGLGVPQRVVNDACIRAATNPLLTGAALQEVLQRYESDAMFREVVSPLIPDEGVGLQPFFYAGHHFLAVASKPRGEVVILVDPNNAAALVQHASSKK